MDRQIGGVAAVFVIACAGWMALGSSMLVRTESADSSLRSKVGELWGTPLVQRAPIGQIHTIRQVEHESWEEKNGDRKKTVTSEKVEEVSPAALVASGVELDLNLDQRRKGLLWYSTFRIGFRGQFTFEHVFEKEGDLELIFEFPSASGIYDDFAIQLNGEVCRIERDDIGRVLIRFPSKTGQRHELSVAYVSQGLDRFVYQHGEGIAGVNGFNLVAHTDFDGFDFPDGTMSPTEKKQSDVGWDLTWAYRSVITGSGIGIEMPKRINPGPLAARISFFAPVSLGFYFFLVLVIAALKGLRLHAMHYFFLAASFFAFHLLLAYLVDHISIHLAFVVCSVVSLFLVLSYLRIVAGAKITFGPFALAQVVYLVGFSYAFFFEGLTGLTVTIGAIVTLFVVMQLTARIDWWSVGSGNGSQPAPPAIEP